MSWKTVGNTVGLLALGGLLQSALAYGASSVPELEGPIVRLVNSVSGPIAVAIATLVLVGAGFMWASSEGLAFHRLSNMVLGISVALFAATLIASIWNRAAAAPLVVEPSAPASVVLESLVDLGVYGVLLWVTWRILWSPLLRSLQALRRKGA